MRVPATKVAASLSKTADAPRYVSIARAITLEHQMKGKLLPIDRREGTVQP